MLSESELKKLIDRTVFDRLTSIDNLLYQNTILLQRLNENIEKLTNVLAGKEKIEVHVTPEHELFYMPLSKKWAWDPTILTNKTLKAGDTKVIERKGSGWFWYALLYSTSPEIRFMVDIHGDSVIEINVSIEELRMLGKENSPAGIRILRYHDADATSTDPYELYPAYVLEWAPGATAPFGVPFKGKNVFKLYNPTSSDITYSFWAWRIMFRED